MRKGLWLLSNMMALFLLQHLHVTVSLSYNMQKLALFQFKLSLAISPSASAICDERLGIPSYPKTMNWSMSSDCCTWDGVTCNQKTGKVIGLDLRCSQLVGSLPPNSTLFNLSHLQSLSFSFNDLYGVLPEDIFHLPNLKELYLNSNLNLTVRLPKIKWGSSGSLQMLFITQTNLSGEIPDSIGYLQSLTILELSDGNLSGGISRSIGNLTHLSSLYLSSNHLSGQIPDSLSNLKNLTWLTLSNNNLIGRFPSWVVNLKQLEALDLSENFLTGPLPSKLSALCLPNLTFLTLQNNLLNGTVDTEYKSTQLGI